MMVELNPVPFGRCRGPWRERKHRTVPTIGKSASRLFRPVRFCNTWLCNEPYTQWWCQGTVVGHSERAAPEGTRATDTQGRATNRECASHK